MININIDFSEIDKLINPSFYPLFKDKSRFLILCGGAGSGKSVFSLQKMIIRCLMNKEKFLFIRKDSVQCRDTVFSLTKYMLEQWNLTNIVKIKESTMEILFDNGSQILHKGINDSEKIKSIPNISSLWVEEATDITESDLNQLNTRLRGITPSYKQIILTFNPISENHWLKKKFFDEEYDDCLINKSTYLDNKFLDREDYEKKVLNKYRDKKDTDVYKYGKWGVLEHQIFKNYEIVDNINTEQVGRDRIKFDIDSMRFGIDFGFHHSILLLVGYHENNVYILDELHCKDKNSDDFISECHKRIDYLNKINKKINHKKIKIIADCEDPSTIQLFRKSGFLIIGCKKNKNSVQDSINWLKNRDIIIDSKCKNIIEEISSYMYKKDNKTNIIYDTPDSKCQDHSLDALRYSVEDFIIPIKFSYALGKQRDSVNAFKGYI